MKGYVLNTTPSWTHAMKRSVGPGMKIPLEELFEQYGAKHEIRDGKEFVEWLRNVKLRDHNKWKIVLEDEATETTKTNKEVDEPQTRVVGGQPPMVAVKTTVQDVVGMSVREAREKLPKIQDLNLLKYAMQEANQLSGKDSLCKIIRKRIRDLQIAR